MWPRGNLHAQLATIDDRLANIATTLREAVGHDELALLVELEDRYNELLDQRNQVAAMLPKPRASDE